MRKTRATSRGATSAGLGNAFLAARTETYAVAAPPRQDLHLANRFGLPRATAALIAELAWPSLDHWSARA